MNALEFWITVPDTLYIECVRYVRPEVGYLVFKATPTSVFTCLDAGYIFNKYTVKWYLTSINYLQSFLNFLIIFI